MKFTTTMFYLLCICTIAPFARNNDKNQVPIAKSAAKALDTINLSDYKIQNENVKQSPVKDDKTKSRFDNDIANIASEIAENLKLSPDKPLYITTLAEDKEYMLPMEPVFYKLKMALKNYVSEVRFKSPQGSETDVISEIIRKGTSMKMEEMLIDSLILTGSYFLMNQSLDRINCVLKIQDVRAVKLFQSQEFTIYMNDCPPELQRSVFDNLLNKEAYGEIEYRGKVIKKLESLFNSGDNNLLLPPAVYAFENRHPYAIDYQITALREILTIKYGISDSAGARNKIIIPADGSLIFVKDGKERQLQKIIDGEPLFGNDYSKPCTTYKYRNPSTKKTSFETREFSTPGELTVRDRIFETFNSYYPALFNPFDYQKLDEIYVDKKEPSILIGNVKLSDPNTGKEYVEYSWSTKQQWLDHLKRLHDTLNRSFEVHTGVMMVFKDDLDPNRYWAIVRQNWKTKDCFGKTVYQDDGFLFVNFDFTVDRVLKDFKIYYRLWFYEYQYDDIELGIKRYEKLEKDITAYFKNGIKSVSDSLKKEMCDYLIGEIRKGGEGVRAK